MMLKQVRAMTPFPESATLALWLGLGLALVVGLLALVRLVTILRAKSDRRDGRS